MTAPPYPTPMASLDFGPEPHSEVTAWVKRVFETLQEREPDPVEDAERAAHFETWKAKQK
ncbi:MAG: hypothetical protein ACK5X3_23790 [Pseudomonadota bacterium]|jgi:hypothetical protein